MLKDAKDVRTEISWRRKQSKTTGRRFDANDVIDFFSFKERRCTEMIRALMQDLRSTEVDAEILASLMDAIGFENLHSIPSEISDAMGHYDSKIHFLNAFFVFFSLPCGDDFVEKWKTESNRSDLIQNFLKSYLNDPRVNPALVDRTPAALGTREFQKLCDAY